MNPTTIRQYTEASLKLEVLKLRGKALNEMIAREERYANVLMKCVGVVFVGALLLLLMSCSELKEGEVVAKYIEPERDYLYMMPIYHSTGKSGFYTFIPIWMHDDEDYKVVIEGVNDDGETTQETVYVSLNRFNCLKSGDHFMIDQDCSSEPNEDKKK